MIRVTLCSVDVKSKFDFTLDTAPSFSAEMRFLALSLSLSLALSLLSQSVSQSVSPSVGGRDQREQRDQPPARPPVPPQTLSS